MGGCPGTQAGFCAISREWGDPSELWLIVLTHAHPDHTGTIPALLKHTNMRVLVHSGDVKWESPSPPWLFYPGQLVSLPGKVPFVRKIFADEIVADGYNIPVMGELRVLHTPGHTPGSICLHVEEQGVMFTGDMLISDGKRFTRPQPFPGFDPKSYRESLERLSELEFDVACVGHERPLVGGAPEKVSEMLENYFWAAPWWKLVRKLRWTRLVGQDRCRIK